MLWNPLEAHLSFLEAGGYDAALRGTLASLGAGILEADARIERIVEKTPEDVDLFVADECEQLENLLGATFIVCQTQITAVASRGIKLAAYCKNTATPFGVYASRKDLLAMGSKLGSLSVTTIQFMDAVANYFKHHDEWETTDWTRLKRDESKRTAAMIQAGGLESGSSGNLRTAAKALGNTTYASTDIFANIIDAWSAEVVATTKRALGR